MYITVYLFIKISQNLWGSYVSEFRSTLFTDTKLNVSHAIHFNIVLSQLHCTLTTSVIWRVCVECCFMLVFLFRAMWQILVLSTQPSDSGFSSLSQSEIKGQRLQVQIREIPVELRIRGTETNTSRGIVTFIDNALRLNKPLCKQQGCAQLYNYWIKHCCSHLLAPEMRASLTSVFLLAHI